MQKTTNSHWMEYQLQRTHAEAILRASWHLSYNDWLGFFLKNGKLRDHPPVTSTYWVTRIDRKGAFTLDNIRCSKLHEVSQPPTDIYRKSADGDYRLWRKTGV